MKNEYSEKLTDITEQYELLINRKNKKEKPYKGRAFDRYKFPVLTSEHIPLSWRFDMNEKANPFLLERFGINAVLNPGAIRWKGKYLLMARVEGVNRKSFFAIAESKNGIDQFRFWDRPVTMPALSNQETNFYDVRLTAHEDGWVYGLFCTEMRDPAVPDGDQSTAIAQCGIARTKDLVVWERLKNLVTPSPQQRNVVLHPEFVHGKYAFYTRPQDSFIEAGKGGGIGFGLADSMEEAVIGQEWIIDRKIYHTVYELKNGQGPTPIKTRLGWLHLAHGVRNTAAGLRYVLYVFVTSLEDPSRQIYKPGGYFLAPEEEERTGDVSNVAFSNGWIADEDGTVFIYYASSDTRVHVAVSTIEKLLDYAIHTPADGFTSVQSVVQINLLIDKNAKLAKNKNVRKKWQHPMNDPGNPISLEAAWKALPGEMENELSRILQYWEKYSTDESSGGFAGRIDQDNAIVPGAPKGSVLNTRILWTFSAAYLHNGNPRYLALATRAYRYIIEFFNDPEFGGLYWSVNYQGKMLDGRKQVYAMAFGIYGLSEYFKASEDISALELAIQWWQLIKKNSFDRKQGGYIDAFARGWSFLKDKRLSEKDENASKTMNTHLHIVEAFANLYQVHPVEELKKDILHLLDLFDEKIIHKKTHHLGLFFNNDWEMDSTVISYGHDIEAGWLLQSCAESTGDAQAIGTAKKNALLITRAAMEGLDQDGGLWYEFHRGRQELVREKHWWPQAEALIGFCNAWQLTHDNEFRIALVKNWGFIKDKILDKINGEWNWGIDSAQGKWAVRTK